MTALRLARLHRVALLVAFGVERWRAAPGAALVLPVADLVGLLRDGAPDPAPPQVGAVGARPVGLISQHQPGTAAGTAAATAGPPDPLHHRPGPHAGAAPPRRDHRRQPVLA